MRQHRLQCNRFFGRQAVESDAKHLSIFHDIHMGIWLKIIDPNRWCPTKYDHSNLGHLDSFGTLILSHCHMTFQQVPVISSVSSSQVQSLCLQRLWQVPITITSPKPGSYLAGDGSVIPKTLGTSISKKMLVIVRKCSLNMLNANRGKTHLDFIGVRLLKKEAALSSIVLLLDSKSCAEFNSTLFPEAKAISAAPLCSIWECVF